MHRFYVEARSRDSKYYSHNSIRVGLDRFLNNKNINFSIISDIEFKVTDDALNAHLIELDREGKILSMKHKPALVHRDVELFYEKKLFGLETPESLRQTAWFNIMLHFGNPQIKHWSRVHHTWKGHEKPPKGPTGAKMKLQLSCHRCWVWQFSISSVLAVKTYLSKRNTQCQALWQKPKVQKAMKYSHAEDAWYRQSNHTRRRTFFLKCSKRQDWLLPTLYTVCEPPL